MGDDRGIARAVRERYSVERFGQRADLVELDEHAVRHVFFKTHFDALHVGDEKIVADELHAVAERIGEHLPALPVVLRHAVLKRDDRVGIAERDPHIDHLLPRHRDAALREMIAAVLGGEPVGAGRVHGEHEVLAGLVAGKLDGPDDGAQTVLVARKVGGGVAALVADAGGVQHLGKGVEHLAAPAQRFLPALRADGHDHKLLNVRRGGRRVDAAVEHVHHRNGQRFGVHAADVAVQRQTERLGARLRHGERYAEHRVRAETGLVRRAVELDEELVDIRLVERVETVERLGDLAVDVFHRRLHALAEIAGLVSVAQLAGLVNAGGRAGRHGRAAYDAVIERHLHLDRGVAAGVEDLSAENVNNFKIFLHKSSFSVRGCEGSAGRCAALP